MKREEKPLLDENINRVVSILLARDRMSRRELADALGYSPAQMTRAFTGDRTWRVRDLVMMAELFEVAPQLFFDDPDTVVRKTCFAHDLVSV